MVCSASMTPVDIGCRYAAGSLGSEAGCDLVGGPGSASFEVNTYRFKKISELIKYRSKMLCKCACEVRHPCTSVNVPNAICSMIIIVLTHPKCMVVKKCMHISVASITVYMYTSQSTHVILVTVIR